MSAATIDYDKLAQQHGGAINYDALAQTHGATTQATSVPQASGSAPLPGNAITSSDPLGTIKANYEDALRPNNASDGGLLGQAGHTVGRIATKGLVSPVVNAVDAISHPQDTAQSMWNEAKAHPIKTAITTLQPGLKLLPETTFAEGLSQHKPLGENLEDSASTALGNMAMFGGVEGGAKIADAIPTRAKAGALFDTVADAAKNQPVSLTRSQPQLQRMAELAERGGGSLPAPINQLLNRSQRISPLTYPEARDFQSGLSSMSRGDADMSGPMGGQFKQLRSSLHSDVGDAAEGVGMREQYEKAMADYARASAIRNGITKAAKYAIPAAAGTAGIGGVYHLAHSLFGGN